MDIGAWHDERSWTLSYYQLRRGGAGRPRRWRGVRWDIYGQWIGWIGWSGKVGHWPIGRSIRRGLCANLLELSMPGCLATTATAAGTQPSLFGRTRRVAMLYSLYYCLYIYMHIDTYMPRMRNKHRRVCLRCEVMNPGSI
jgi:hypothetical protein